MLSDLPPPSSETTGITDVRLLKLLSLVYVAWADGTLEDVEIERIDRIATAHYGLSLRELDVMDQWLSLRPSHTFFRRGLRELKTLCGLHEAGAAQDIDFIDANERIDLVLFAETVARASARALDDPRAVSPEEETALDELAMCCGVDRGRSLAKLLDELDAPDALAS